jgi:hypothetical protein
MANTKRLNAAADKVVPRRSEIIEQFSVVARLRGAKLRALGISSPLIHARFIC